VPKGVRARGCLAFALADVGLHDEANREGRQVLEEAQSLEIPLAVARAASALVSLPSDVGVIDRQSVREKGRQALAGYLASVPEADRDAVKKRPDLLAMLERLDSAETESTAGG